MSETEKTEAPTISLERRWFRRPIDGFEGVTAEFRELKEGQIQTVLADRKGQELRAVLEENVRDFHGLGEEPVPSLKDVWPQLTTRFVSAVVRRLIDVSTLPREWVGNSEAPSAGGKAGGATTAPNA